MALSLFFALAVCLSSMIRLWLAMRQIRYVAQHRASVPAAFAQSVPLAAHQKAADYTLARVRLGVINTLLSAAVLVGWTLLGGLDALNQTLLAWLGGGMVQQLALLAAFMGIGAVLELPLSLYQTFVLEQRFGFNQMTLALWLADLAKSTLVGTLMGLPIAALILWLMGAAGAAWWLWAWAALMGFNLLMMWLYPSFIAPLFNQFQPLEDEALTHRVTALMQRCGFAAKGLFVMDGSRRSAHANAYFTGFGSAKRVVFFDTLLKQLSPEEVEAVLAHELGHFKHRHVTKHMVSLFVFSLIGFALLGWLSGRGWFYLGLGVVPNLSISGAAPNDALALLLFMLLMPVVSFFFAPLRAWWSQRYEFEADAYAMQQADGCALASALLKLYRDNASTLTPDPWYVAFYYSHPPAAQRLARMPTAVSP